MEISVLASDRREALVNEVPTTIIRTAEVVEGLPRKREDIALRNFDREAIRNEIAAQFYERSNVTLPPVGWYVADHVEGTRIFLIRQVPEVNVGIVGYIPYTYDSFDTPYWDGMIIDLDEPLLQIQNINYSHNLITELPLHANPDGSYDFHGFDQELSNQRVKVNFQGKISLVPYLEAPQLRVWRKNGRVYISNRSRLNVWNLKATHTKTFGQLWKEMTVKTPESLFENVLTDDYCFIMQLCVPELLPYTMTEDYSLIKIADIPIRPTEYPAPEFLIPTLPLYDAEQANNWLGFNKTGDPRLNGGNAIVLADLDTKNFVMIRSHAYAWRSDLIGQYDNAFSWVKRYLEVCNARFLDEEKYLSIFPNIINEPLDKPSARLENVSTIWHLISPPYLQEDTKKLYETYWSSDGEISKLAKYLGDVENVKRLDIHRQRMLYNAINEIRFMNKNKGKNITFEKLYRILLFNSNIQKPHIFGNDLYSLFREMRKQQKYIEFQRQRQTTERTTE